MMSLGRQAVRLPAAVLVVLLVVLLGVPNLPGSLGRLTSTPPSSTEASLGTDTAAVYSGSFAARAGYDSAYLRTVSDITPALGEQLVVVTFRPANSSLFSPPTETGPLSVAAIADRYGLSPSAYAAAQAYFESVGITVVHTEPDRLSLALEGSASAVGRAFSTTLGSGTYGGRSVTFPETSPSLPETLETSVAAVTGLSTGFTVFSLPAGLPGSAVSPSNGPAAGPYDLITPATAREIYDISSLYNVSGASHFATGEGIALLLWGWGYDPNDLSTFFSNEYPSSIFPPPVLRPYPVDGAPYPASNAASDPSKAPEELTLDMEWAGSMAPGATLDAVYAPDGPADQNYSPTVAAMTDALDRAVNDIPGVSVLSMSFGTPESESQSLASAWAVDLGVAMQEGITVLAATGDLGGVSGASCSGAVSVDYPASSPDVLAVGGTAPALARNILGEVTGLEDEPAWIGSGGGFSTNFAAPSWQLVGSAAAPILANASRRGTPDVAAASAYNYLYYDSQSSVAAGTSFATPTWGGLIAEMDALYGARFGFLTPRLYAIGAGQETGRDAIGLADVTSGGNCVYSAAPGWDAVTGWGSPRAVLLYEDLTATFVHLSVSASPSLVAPGGKVSVEAFLSNRTSGTPLAGIPVSVSVSASEPNGPCAGVWASEKLVTNAAGIVELPVTIPVCFLGAHGTTYVSVTSDGYYGTNSTTVDINLLAFVPILVGIESFPWNIIAFVLIMGTCVGVGYVLGRGRSTPSTPPALPPGARGSPPASATPPALVTTGSPAPAPSPPPRTAPSPPAGPPAPPTS